MKRRGSVRGRADAGTGSGPGVERVITVGHASRRRALPAFFVDAALPLSIAARRQAFNEELRVRWRQGWEASPRFIRIRKINPSLPSKKFRKMANKLTHCQASMRVQLRTGHAPLKKHLFRIGRAESPTCLTCGQDDESIHHFLFDCATWRQERWRMGSSLGRATKEADSIMNTPKGIAELMKYVGRTGRFRGVIGELL